LTETLLNQARIDQHEFFGRAASGLALLKASGNSAAAEELEGIVNPIAAKYFRTPEDT
jgi:hypothetical protein